MTDLPKASNPAARALSAIGVTTLEALAEHTEREIAERHGVGPKALRIWKEHLAAKGLSFKA